MHWQVAAFSLRKGRNSPWWWSLKSATFLKLSECSTHIKSAYLGLCPVRFWRGVPDSSCALGPVGNSCYCGGTSSYMVNATANLFAKQLSKPLNFVAAVGSGGAGQPMAADCDTSPCSTSVSQAWSLEPPSSMLVFLFTEHLGVFPWSPTLSYTFEVTSTSRCAVPWKTGPVCKVQKEENIIATLLTDSGSGTIAETNRVIEEITIINLFWNGNYLLTADEMSPETCKEWGKKKEKKNIFLFMNIEQLPD